MPPNREPGKARKGAHGFVLMMPNTVPGIDQKNLYLALRAAGFAPWDGNHFPLFAALHGYAPKHQWFEAGYWVGSKVPLFGFGLGVRFRKRHEDVVSRLGGWMVWVHTAEDLVAAVKRRDIKPSAWDRAQTALWKKSVKESAGPGGREEEE